MKLRGRYLRIFVLLFTFFTFAGIIGGLGLYLYLVPKLPDIDILKDVQLQEPLRIYSSDGKLIAEYGEMKRTPLTFEEYPPRLVQAFIAAEDTRFYEHPGVDYQGILRAAISLILTGEKRQGGSTITMQVARNFFLSREQTYSRKLNEILLALKIERELSKEEIMELYLNKIYLGKRSYGVAAAAQVYYGKELAELDLPQLAMIAGLPKAPSAYNPIANPDRATLRRNYVLGRMLELEFIDDEQYQTALAAPVTAGEHGFESELDAPYLAEMARKEVVERFGNEAYNNGYSVYTTVDSRLQQAANQALHNNLLAYEHRHGYRGPAKQVEIAEDSGIEQWQELLEEFDSIGGLQPALVVGLTEQEAGVALSDGTLRTLKWDGLKWARKHLDDNYIGAELKRADEALSRGDIVYVEQNTEGEWQLAQVPEVAGALVSLDPNNGAVLALTGGFDFFHSKFNRVTQAERQPGSNFKPFVYSAALANGFTLASIINDAPVVFDDSALESEWRPENYSGRFYGPTRLREALVNSRNLVSIRLLQSIGIGTAIRYVGNFGFNPDRLPRDLSLALGTATLTPLEIVRGYATLANGGFLIEPHFIQRIEDSDGKPLYRANPALACEGACQEELIAEVQARIEAQAKEVAAAAAFNQALMPTPAEDEGAPASETELAETDEEVTPEPPLEPVFARRTVDKQNVYLVRSMMEDVIRRGTGRRALQLGRNDLAGKTGTTNDQRDAWFSGYNGDVVTTVWVGFDTPRPLGNSETGARAALPMWIDYMREALKGKPENSMAQPEGMTSVRIDAKTGKYTAADNPDAIFELFRSENAPEADPTMPTGMGNSTSGGGITEELF